MNFKTHLIPCLYLLYKLRYDTCSLLPRNSTSLILVKIHYKRLYGQEDRHLGGVSYRIISNLFYTCFSVVVQLNLFCDENFYFNGSISIRIQDQTICLYACVIKTKAWAPKIRSSSMISWLG